MILLQAVLTSFSLHLSSLTCYKHSLAPTLSIISCLTPCLRIKICERTDRRDQFGLYHLKNAMPTANFCIADTQYEWDTAKNDSNYAKHGICFECACELWATCGSGEIRQSRQDGDDEDRFTARIDGRDPTTTRQFQLFIVFTLRSSTFRVLSAHFKRGKLSTNVVNHCDEEFCRNDALQGPRERWCGTDIVETLQRVLSGFWSRFVT